MKRIESLKNKLMTINIPTYIVIKDKELRYQAINDYTMNIFRLKSEYDLIGKSDFECPWANMAEDIRKYDQQIFEGKTVLHSKVNRYHVNGPRPIIVNKFPLLNEKKIIDGVLIIAHDISATPEECIMTTATPKKHIASEDEVRLTASLKTILNVLLTKKEIACLSLWLAGFSIKESSVFLKISPKSIEAYRTQIKDKLGLKCKFQLIDLVVMKQAFELFLSFSKIIINPLETTPATVAPAPTGLSVNEHLEKYLSNYTIPTLEKRPN